MEHKKYLKQFDFVDVVVELLAVDILIDVVAVVVQKKNRLT